jgi:hypothetical protein
MWYHWMVIKFTYQKKKSILIGAPSKYSKNMLLWFFFENGRNTILGTFENKIQSKPFKNP